MSFAALVAAISLGTLRFGAAFFGLFVAFFGLGLDLGTLTVFGFALGFRWEVGAAFRLRTDDFAALVARFLGFAAVGDFCLWPLRAAPFTAGAGLNFVNSRFFEGIVVN